MIASIVALTSLAANLDNLAFEGLLRHYGELAAQVRTLDVTYTHTEFGRPTDYHGRFRLRQTPNGRVVAKLELGDEHSPRETYLLRDRTLYEVAPREKLIRVYRYDQETDIRSALRRWWNPLVGMLDPVAAKEHLDLTVTKSDDWYTYFSVVYREPTPPLSEPFSWFGPGQFYRELQLEVRNHATDTIPRSVPYRIWMPDESGDHVTWTVERWIQDGPAFPKGTFEVPEVKEVWTWVDGFPPTPGLTKETGSREK